MNHTLRNAALLSGLILITGSLLAPATSSHAAPDSKSEDALTIATDKPTKAKKRPPKRQRPVVEVVFALDTTGSMAGLLEGAKRKVWGIANHIASGDPTPIARIGLVGYRDISDAYVTKRFDMTSDLDTVYQSLSTFDANGGGDWPEHANKALHEAVNETQWSENSMKIVFLVGDAPPHMDYQDGYDYRKIVKQARQKGIVIHTIQCGDRADTRQVWQAIARTGGGSFTSISQDGGVMAIATPYDDQLAKLSRKLNETAVIYGGAEAHTRMAKKASVAESAPAAAAADRGGYYSKTNASLDDADIVGSVASGKVDVGSLAEERLPENMRKMSKAERKRHIKKQQAKRKKIMKEMAKLSKKRDAYIKKQQKRKGAKGFDQAVQRAITKQAKRHGIKY